MDFIAIDFETATSLYSSACSLGMIFVENNQIVDEKYYLINPPNNQVDEDNFKIHNLSSTDLVDSPNFQAVWEEIKHCFTSTTPIVAHNAPFDINVLKNSLIYYNFQIPDIRYFDSIAFSQQACKTRNVGRSLKDRTEYFGITIENAHNSLADARAVALLLLRCMEVNNTNSIEDYLTSYGVPVRSILTFNHSKEFSKRGVSKFTDKKIDSVEAQVDKFDVNHPFFGKQIVFTGDLSSVDRKSAAQKVKNFGAIIKNGVSRNTNYLIVGTQDVSLVGSKGRSTKEIKAAELIEKGFDIQILNEEQFFVLLNYRSQDEQFITKEEHIEEQLKEKMEKEREKLERELWWT